MTHPPPEDLVDGCGLLEGALGLHHRPHLLHVQHEGVQRLLDVRLLLLRGVVVLVVVVDEVGRPVAVLLQRYSEDGRVLYLEPYLFDMR